MKSNTFTQIASALDEVIRGGGVDTDREAAALQEAQEAVVNVLHTGRPQELSPQGSRIRKMQHQIVESKKLASESVGLDPQRRLLVLPVRLA